MLSYENSFSVLDEGDCMLDEMVMMTENNLWHPRRFFNRLRRLRPETTGGPTLRYQKWEYNHHQKAVSATLPRVTNDDFRI